jgi:hypothetical protein
LLGCALPRLRFADRAFFPEINEIRTVSEAQAR